MLSAIPRRSRAQLVGTLTAVALIACGGGRSTIDESYVTAMSEANKDLEPGVAAAFALEDEEEQANSFRRRHRWPGS